MTTIYLLCMDGDVPGAWNALTWSADKALLERVALKKCWEAYRHLKALKEADPTITWRNLSPDETDYRLFYVLPVEQQSVDGNGGPQS